MRDSRVGITRRAVLLLAVVLLGVVIAWGLTWPLATRQGVNYRQTTRNIPTYVKAIDFVQRHLQYKVLTSTICADLTSPRDCMLAIFNWTGTNIRQTPDGWPVIDDHVLHIIIRGHGKDDQMADVFTTLSTYAGIPAFWHELKDRQGRTSRIFSFVRLGYGWTPVDVERQVLFRDDEHRLATVDELLHNRQLLDVASGSGRLDYSSLFSDPFLDPFVAPDPLRAELHQPWARLKYEIGQAVGLGSVR